MASTISLLVSLDLSSLSVWFQRTVIWKSCRSWSDEEDVFLIDFFAMAAVRSRGESPTITALTSCQVITVPVFPVGKINLYWLSLLFESVIITTAHQISNLNF